MVIAYLMKIKNMNYDTAYSFVNKRREWVSPNPGFVKALKQFEQTLQSEI